MVNVTALFTSFPLLCYHHLHLLLVITSPPYSDHPYLPVVITSTSQFSPPTPPCSHQVHHHILITSTTIFSSHPHSPSPPYSHHPITLFSSRPPPYSHHPHLPVHPPHVDITTTSLFTSPLPRLQLDSDRHGRGVPTTRLPAGQLQLHVVGEERLSLHALSPTRLHRRRVVHFGLSTRCEHTDRVENLW